MTHPVPTPTPSHFTPPPPPPSHTPPSHTAIPHTPPYSASAQRAIRTATLRTPIRGHSRISGLRSRRRISGRRKLVLEGDQDSRSIVLFRARLNLSKVQVRVNLSKVNLVKVVGDSRPATRTLVLARLDSQQGMKRADDRPRR